MRWNSCIHFSFLIVQEWGFARSAGPVFLKAFIESRAPSLNGKLCHGPMTIIVFMTEERASHHVIVFQSVFDNR